MGINGDPVVIKVDGSDPLPVTVDGAVTIAEPVTVDGTVAVSSVGGTVAVSSVADPVTIAIRTDIDAGNSNDGTLGAGLTWTGTWANLDGLAQVFFNVKSDQAGTYTMQFSSDGITADRTLGPYDLSAGGNAAQPLAAVRGYFRGTFPAMTECVAVALLALVNSSERRT